MMITNDLNTSQVTTKYIDYILLRTFIELRINSKIVDKREEYCTHCFNSNIDIPISGNTTK